MFGARMEELKEERRKLDAAEAAWLGKLATYDRSGAWRDDGFVNVAVALRVACRLDPGTAAGHVGLARKLERLPSSATIGGTIPAPPPNIGPTPSSPAPGSCSTPEHSAARAVI